MTTTLSEYIKEIKNKEKRRQITIINGRLSQPEEIDLEQQVDNLRQELSISFKQLKYLKGPAKHELIGKIQELMEMIKELENKIEQSAYITITKKEL